MGERGGIRWGWCGAVVAAVLMAVLAGHFYLRNLREPMLLDFAAYWAAGQLALRGNAAAAWDLQAHRAVVATVTTEGGMMPFPYPPPFLFPLLPVSWLPYHQAFAAWVLLTGAFYLWSARAVAPVSQAAAQPAVLINMLIGQNGFLSAGLFFAGASRLSERPFLAGAILGLLVFKPQLALMLPVAVIAARAWPAVLGAAASAGGLLLAALLVFGLESYSAFLTLLPAYSEWMAADRFSWEEFASPFAFLRVLGVGPGAAMPGQVAAFACAAALCWAAWRGAWEQRVPILCAASLLGSPYLQSYDTLLMLAPIGWFLTRRPGAALSLYLLCLVPVLTQVGVAGLPNPVPIAAALSLGLLWQERRGVGEPLPQPATA